MTAPTAYTTASGKVVDFTGLAIRADQIQDQNGNAVDLTPAAAVVSLTDSTGYSGSHNDTLAASTVPTTLTDSTGQSGSHDDTLAATTTMADLTGGESPTEAEFNTLLAEVRIMCQNASDTAQKVIEHNALLAVMAQNDSDTAQKVNEILTALRDAGIIAT